MRCRTENNGTERAYQIAKRKWILRVGAHQDPAQHKVLLPLYCKGEREKKQ